MSIEQVKVPVLAESVADATLLDWHKNEGDAVQEGDKLVDIETDKVVLEVVAPMAGTLVKIVKGNGEDVTSEELIAELDSSLVQAAAAAVEAAPEAAAPAAASADPKTSPAVRKMANEQGVNPADVAHTGDRVTKADMVANAAKPAAAPAAPISVSLDGRPEERVPMTRLRKRVSERLLGAQHEHAILTTFNEINMKPLMDLRKRYKEQFEKEHGCRLGFMSAFTKATVAALKKFPIINASTEGNDIIYHGYYDIGIAVSSPRGLVVPILRNVDQMSFADVEAGINDFGQRARAGTLGLEDLTGGTFSITNGGTFGSMMSTPILNPPQSAILGMHNIVERPVVENGEIVIRPIMYVALSYDHRIIDGSDAVRFLVAIKNAVEDPSRLLLGV